MSTAHHKSCWICAQAKVWAGYGEPFCDCGKAMNTTDQEFLRRYNAQIDAGRNEREIAVVCKSYTELEPLTDTAPSSLAELI